MEFFCGDETVAQRQVMLSLQAPPKPQDPTAAMCASAFEADRYWGLPAVAQMSGDTAVIRVAGGLTPGSAGWKRAFGMIGYEDIKGALVESAGRNDVKGILLYLDTPGGAVNGVEATTRLIGEVAKIKPVVGYAACAASAGYWLASATDYMVADATSILGSLGTIVQLVNLVDANAKEGVKFHTFKSGSLKMAGNANEEMTEEAKALFQEQVDDMSAIFYSQIAKNRGMDYSELKARFGDGRHVLAARALAGGLIDELGGIGQAFAKLKELVSAKQETNIQHL